MQHALIGRAVPEERDGDLSTPPDARREPGAGGEGDAAADDGVGAEHPP